MTVSDMRQARRSPATIFLEFTRLYKHSPSTLFCFFEGEDSQYYGVRIKTIAKPEKDKYFNCNGKKGVLETHKIISYHEEYKAAKTAFFVDKDFDESIYTTLQGITNIYETPCYSVENFYTSLSAFREVLRNEFKMEELEKDSQNLENLFFQRQQEFHKSVELLNAWIACQKRLGAKLYLSNYSVDDFIEIELTKITVNYDLSKLETKFPSLPSIAQADLDAKIEEFQLAGCQTAFRGKFEIDFLFIFLRKLIDEARKRSSPYFTKKLKVKLQTSRASIISDLSQYADTPPCLFNFLESLAS
ncbi:DUF4435 domain-containing protein [Kovacikia minuta CCNUW1]|uniref:DUF4435 domain-containing protein n=1 Tax=Kovacikia minuta TaxID=2931930 RepID=UPI001CCC9432|nr:DUF4435 domain-containing protein [Kovacikia minuta]UBF23972.1 DUF4435 domain-containing protein [Kovacikia minuta CCNUW1]